MLDFCPQHLRDKEYGRQSLLKVAGLSHDQVSFTPDVTDFQARYNEFVRAFPAESKRISNARPDGIGPGEMVCFFLFDSITLGGRNAACDLRIDGVDFAEMKAGVFSRPTNSIYDFKLSRDQAPSAQFAAKYLNKKTEDPSVVISHDGFVWTIDGQPIVIEEERGFEEQVRLFMNSKRENAVHRSRGQTIDVWKDMLFEEIGLEKTYAFIRTDTLEMLYFGFLRKEMVDHYRNHRNQPYARVYLR